MRCSWVMGATLAVALIACGGSDGDGGGGPAPAASAVVLSRTGGDQQSAPGGTALPVPLAVQVADSDGVVQTGRTVRWSVTGGDAALGASTSTTDSDGRTSVPVQFGAGVGQVQVQAEVFEGGVVVGTPIGFLLQSVARSPVVLLHEEPIPANYGIHDTFVRDGLAFVSAWNTGLQIWDVGNGIRGGSPSHPVFVSGKVPSAGPSGITGAIHNSWWFHNPVTGEKRYLFVGQEGPGSIGSSSQGDIYVLDVSDLTSPREVANFHLAGAGTHNFWMDEASQVLYAAYYNGGVVALDVSGTLSGDLSSRLIANVKPGGPDQTYAWGVQFHDGSLYVSDMESGLWQLAPASGGLATISGGFNVPERWTSDLWVHGSHAYTGTWGGLPRNGNAGNVLKTWWLVRGLASPVDSIVLPNVGTVSDVEVTTDGKALLLTAERGSEQGIYIYTLADPGHPQRAGALRVPNGLHTGTFADIGGRRFVFAARNPSAPALETFDVTDAVP